jgi:endo-1,4-beta-D-glucanase Y
VLAGGGVATAVGYFNSQQRSIPLVFSNNALLLETWNEYKKNNIQPSSGRTIDKSQNDLTTSEGESYTMLRSVWMDDKSTFDNSWQFTENNLQRPDHLFSWKYGKISSGEYGILTSEGGENTASDADEDIALSLLMAYSRWNDSKYLQAAQPIITSIWNEEVVNVDGKPVLTADDLERNSKTTVVVDPSYFAPADYKIFAKIDPMQNWAGLTSNSYSLLDELSSAPLDKNHSDGLPPDWIEINRTNGALVPAATSSLDTNFSYDAMRIPFRLALDYSWFKDPRDLATLSRFGFLKQFWENTHVLNASYAHDGSVVSDYESPAIYGGTIGYFKLIDPADAKQIYKTKLQTLYSPDQESWKAPAPGYYEDNWAWFGIALYDNALPNITAGR